MTSTDGEARFESILDGIYFARKGPAHGKGHSGKKLCIVATDRDALAQLLYALSCREDCCSVRYHATGKDGMYLGECWLANDDATGEVWAGLENHPKVVCAIQDDVLTQRFRDRSSSETAY